MLNIFLILLKNFDILFPTISLENIDMFISCLLIFISMTLMVSIALLPLHSILTLLTYFLSFKGKYFFSSFWWHYSIFILSIAQLPQYWRSSILGFINFSNHFVNPLSFISLHFSIIPYLTQILLCRPIDIADMRRHVNYSGGYHDSQPYIQVLIKTIACVIYIYSCMILNLNNVKPMN